MRKLVVTLKIIRRNCGPMKSRTIECQSILTGKALVIVTHRENERVRVIH